MSPEPNLVHRTLTVVSQTRSYYACFLEGKSLTPDAFSERNQYKTQDQGKYTTQGTSRNFYLALYSGNSLYQQIY